MVTFRVFSGWGGSVAGVQLEIQISSTCCEASRGGLAGPAKAGKASVVEAGI